MHGVDPRTDTLQDLCGVGYYELSDQERNFLDNPLTDVGQLLAPLSYASTFSDAVIAAASARNITEACSVVVQYDFAYDPEQVVRPIAESPVFIGVFEFSHE